MKNLSLVLAFMLFSNFANALSITGSLDRLYDYNVLELNVSQQSTVNFWTDSFSPNFDPMLGLFNEQGSLIVWNDDHGSTFGGANPGLNYALQDL